MESDKKSIINFIYKWLPIIFGCHHRADRSFFFRGKQFPICARCTGELLGIIVSLIYGFFYQVQPWICFLLLLPMILDGLVQLLTSYESNNTKRVITGFCFGFGLGMLFVLMTVEAFQFGVELGRKYSLTH